MAGEFSRELSRKVWASQARHAALGYRMGGRTPYGMRRMLLDDRGAPKLELAPGQVKNIRSEKVVLVPGPVEELEVIRRIYRLSIRSRLYDGEIAQLLNEEGVPAVGGRPWSNFLVRQILTSELYLGTALFNRVSQKMGGLQVRNPPEQWIRREAAFQPVISRRTFLDAQRCRHKRRSFKLTEDELLEPLRQLLAKEGKLSLPLIMATPDMPNHASYRRRYGSLDAAYAKVGYFRPSNGPAWGSPAVMERAAAFCTQAASTIKQSGGRLYRGRATGLIIVDKRLRLGTTVARFHDGARDQFWEVTINRSHATDYILAALLQADDSSVEAYYLFPSDQFPPGGTIRILGERGKYARCRLPDLLSLYAAISGQDPAAFT